MRRPAVGTAFATLFPRLAQMVAAHQYQYHESSHRQRVHLFFPVFAVGLNRMVLLMLPAVGDAAGCN